MRPPKVSSLLYKSRFIQLFTNYQSPSGMEESPSASFAYIITQKGKAGNSIKITYLLCVRTPVIIQFGVSYLQAGVGAKWVQIM